MVLAEDVEGGRVVQLEGGVDGERLVPRVVGQEEVRRYVPFRAEKFTYSAIYRYIMSIFNATHMLLYRFLRSTTELSGKWSETLGTETL